MRIRRSLALAAGVLAVSAPAAAAHGKHHHHPKKPKSVDVQLLGLNDFHGHIESTTPGAIQTTPDPASRVNAGGAEYLATHVKQLKAQNRNLLVVSAGDLIGASPLISALFHDEPTIEAMNEIGLDLNAVGNHEFDEGADELRRMQRGGCHPVDGCFGGDGFRGAKFNFLAANVVDEKTGRPVFKPYEIRKFDGVKVGFIGMTLEGTPDIVAQAGIKGLKFLDEAQTANKYTKELRRQGVEAIVVLLHEGGSQAAPFGVNTCTGITGPIVDIVNRTSNDVDLFMTGHTHQPYNCVIDGRPVTSAASFGRLVTDIDLKVDRRSGDVRTVSANNVVITQDVPKAPRLTKLIERYSALAAPLANRQVGTVTAPVTRTNDDSLEQPMGNLIADAQQAAGASAGSQAAFMNPGGVRADIPDAGPVTYGEAFTVQPFGNSLVTLTLTGAQVDTMLKQQWCEQTSPRVLLPSAEVSYSWDAAAATAITNQPCASAASPIRDLKIGGIAVDPAASYRITVNSFLADGGDRFFVLREGTARTGGPLDLDALETFLQPSIAGPAVAPPATDRIARIG